MATRGAKPKPAHLRIVDGTNNVWTANTGDGTLTRLAPDGKVVATYALADGFGVVSDGDRTVWVTQPAQGKLAKLIVK